MKRILSLFLATLLVFLVVMSASCTGCVPPDDSSSEESTSESSSAESSSESSSSSEESSSESESIENAIPDVDENGNGDNVGGLDGILP